MARVTMLLDNDFSRDRRVQKEAASLLRAGHEVRVVALRTPGSPRRERWEGVDVRRVPPAPFAGWRGPSRAIDVLLWYERLFPLGLEAGRRPAEIVHAHDLTTLGPARRAARRLGAGLVYDDHELYVETLNTTWPRDRGRLATTLFRASAAYLAVVGTRLEARWVRGIAGHITVSPSIAREIERRYRCPRPVVVANCPRRRPPPEPDGRLRRALGAAPGTRIVLYQGTFPQSGAGLVDLVDAAALLPRRVFLAFLGFGSGRPSLERRAREAGVADRVRFLDPVPAEEVPAWVADADAAAVPNRPSNLSNVLALPNKLFEAMMAGVPVVAAGTVEVVRVLRQYPAGLTYRMGEVGDLAAKVLAVTEATAADRAAFARAGRRGTAESYCWERQEEKLLSLYEAILKRREAPCTGRS